MEEPGKILVVDDNPYDLILIKELLNEEYHIQTVSSAKAALKSLRKQSFNLVITDMCMPQMDGFEFIESIKKLYPYLPIVLLSASLEGDYKQKADEMDIAAYLNKPIDTSLFKNTIKKVMSHFHN
jgi:CheY-like chemotaxis protein